MSIFPLAPVSTRKCLGAGRQEVKREKTRRRWTIALEFMVVVALAVAARVLFSLLELCSLRRVPKTFLWKSYVNGEGGDTNKIFLNKILDLGVTGRRRRPSALEPRRFW